MTTATHKVSFRSLAAADIELLHRWLNDPMVVRWYGRHAPSFDEVQHKYRKRIDHTSPVRVFVVAANDYDVGLAQHYPVDCFPGYAAAIRAKPGWFGLDYLIGEPSFRGIVLAPTILDDFVTSLVFATGCSACCATPAVDNRRSIAAFIKAAFSTLGDVAMESGEVERLMIRYPDHAARPFVQPDSRPVGRGLS